MCTDDGLEERDALASQSPSLKTAYDRLWDQYHALRSAVQTDDWRRADELAGTELPVDALPPFNPLLLERLDDTLDSMSVRLANTLQNRGFEYFWQVCEKTATELLELKRFGKKAVQELETLLRDRGLHLGMDVRGVKAYLRTPRDQRTVNL